MAFSPEQAELARQASFGDDITSQREAAVALYDNLEQEQPLPKQEQLPTWDEVSAQEELPTWDQVNKGAYADPKADAEVLDNLPDRLKFGLWEIPIDVPKQTAAFWVGAGHGMSWAYRGIKQLMGIDEQSMAADEAAMKDLYASDRAGSWAKGGQIYGSLFEPAGAAIPVMKGKTVLGTAAKAGAVTGAYGATGYVGEGESRIGNALLYGTLGAGIAGTLKGVEKLVQRTQVNKANEFLNTFEKRTAENILRNYKEGTDILAVSHQSAKDALTSLPKGNLRKAVELTGRKPVPPKTIEEAKAVVDFYHSPYKASDVKVGLDSILGITSTRINNIHQGIGYKLREHDLNVLKGQKQYFNRVDKFFEKYKSLYGGNPQMKATLDNALRDGNFVAVEKEFRNTGMLPEWTEVRKVLDEIGTEAKAMGLLEDTLTNYFPRFIKDREGMLKALGTQERKAVEEALKKANARAADHGRQLSAVDEADVINKVLRGSPKVVTGGKNVFTKERKFNKIPEFLQQYYSTPEESLHSYVRNMINDMEKAKFFGKHKKTVPLGDTNVLDINASVGNYIRNELVASPMSASEEKELIHLLQTRFGVGERSPAGLVQDTKNLLYTMLLANPVSAAVQLGDIGVSVVLNGFKNTMKALPKAIIGKGEVTAKDWYLTDQLAEEFATSRQTARWLHRAFTYSGFKYADRLGKDTFIQSSFNKLQDDVGKIGSAKERAFRDKYRTSLGKDLDKVIQDLRTKTVSPEVELLLFSKLADIQPISLSEVPEMYLKMPNGRIMYMLKTFMLKQVDLIRREGIQEIKKGNTAKGLAFMAKYGLVMGSAGVATQEIKNAMLYAGTGETPPETSFSEDVGTNLLKTFGWSEYVSNKLKEGKITPAVLEMVVPPTEVFDKIISGEEGEWTQYMPVIGRMWYYWMEGGAKKAVERAQKRQEQKLTEELGYGDVNEEYKNLLEEQE